MSTRTILPIAVAALLAAAPVLAGGRAGTLRVKTTKRAIEAIAMDGPIVAYDLRAGEGCNQVFTWNVNTNGGRIVSGDGTCEADSSSTGAGVSDLAVGGQRLAWITNGGGNTESDDDLYTSTLPKPKERHLASAMRFGDIDGQLDGQWIGGLYGDGSLVAVSTWTTQAGAVRLDAEGDIAVYGQYCQSADSCGRNMYAARISTGKTVLLARAPSDIVGLEIEPAGVLYGYNTARGALVLRSLAQVEAALG